MVALLLCTSSGCGTMTNLTGADALVLGPPPNRPFGGVDRDVKGISAGTVVTSAIQAIDLPFSLIGDIITLPWTIYQSQQPDSEQPRPPYIPTQPWVP